MELKVHLDTRDDFINFFQWAADILLKGDIYHLFDQCDIEVDDLCNSIENDEDFYYEFKEEFPEEYFGEYYVYFDDSWDRSGDSTIRMFIKLEEETYKVDDLLKEYNTLNDARLVLAKKYEKIYNVVKTMNVKDLKHDFSTEEFNEMISLENKIKEKFGVGL